MRGLYVIEPRSIVDAKRENVKTALGCPNSDYDIATATVFQNWKA